MGKTKKNIIFYSLCTNIVLLPYSNFLFWGAFLDMIAKYAGSAYIGQGGTKLKWDVPILTCVFSFLTDWPWPLRHILYNFTLRLLLIFSPGAKYEYDNGDEAVMKIHKKIKIGIPEIGTFSAITAKV